MKGQNRERGAGRQAGRQAMRGIGLERDHERCWRSDTRQTPCRLSGRPSYTADPPPRRCLKDRSLWRFHLSRSAFDEGGATTTHPRCRLQDQRCRCAGNPLWRRTAVNYMPPGERMIFVHTWVQRHGHRPDSDVVGPHRLLWDVGQLGLAGFLDDDGFHCSKVPCRSVVGPGFTAQIVCN